MEYRYMPGTSLSLSVLSLGTMQFGGQTSEADSLKIMDYAFDHGINVFDTANIYINGESERIVGKALKGRRDKIVLATKTGTRKSDDINTSGLSRRYIIDSVENSLKRLNTDFIDIFYLHTPDPDTALEESLETLNTLVKAGKVRYIGVSNYAAWQIAEMYRICEKNSFVRVSVSQNVYNLLTRSIEPELIPCLETYKVGLFLYNPIMGGLLTGKHKPGTPDVGTRFSNEHSQANTYFTRYWNDINFDAVEKLKKIAEEHGLSILELAMKWCLHNTAVTSLIIGASRLSQIEQNIELIKGKALDEQVLGKCDELWKSLTGDRFFYVRPR